MKEIKIDELKRIQLEMLKALDSFCKQNDIRYSLAYGTLLGAVRHKGYIPWDDDLDIMLLRDDYDKFIKLFNLNDYCIIEPKIDKEYSLPFAKVYDKRTIIDEFADVKNLYGVYIDVFPIDKAPNNPAELESFMKEKDKLNKYHLLKIVPIRFNRNPLKNIVLMIGKLILANKSINAISRQMSDLSSKYAYLTKSKMMGIIAPNDNRREELLPSEYFDYYTTLPFEGFEAMVIRKYDEYLSASYGDYMKFPPIDKRVSHHRFKAWWKE